MYWYYSGRVWHWDFFLVIMHQVLVAFIYQSDKTHIYLYMRVQNSTCTNRIDWLFHLRLTTISPDWALFSSKAFVKVPLLKHTYFFCMSIHSSYTSASLLTHLPRILKQTKTWQRALGLGGSYKEVIL